MIKKIKMPSAKEFYERYMKTLEPVVITDMFAGEAVREIRSREDVVREWGHVQIAMQSEYTAAYEKDKGKHEPSSEVNGSMITIAEYYEFVRKNPTTKKMCIEFPNPDAIKSKFHVPEVCKSQPGESAFFINQCFIGNKGNYAHIHFDKAGSHGFLYQVFGRKKFIVWNAEASAKLAPFTQVSGWNLENFSAKDRVAFLEFTGGQEVLLEQGDCMFVPLMCWHYVDYLDDSMSISLRFRRPNYMTKLANIMFPDLYYQGIAYKLATESVSEADRASIVAQLEDAWAQPMADGHLKVEKCRELARDIYVKLYGDGSEKPYFMEFEKHMPPLLPNYLDANHPGRPIRE